MCSSVEHQPHDGTERESRFRWIAQGNGDLFRTISLKSEKPQGIGEEPRFRLRGRNIDIERREGVFVKLERDRVVGDELGIWPCAECRRHRGLPGSTGTHEGHGTLSDAGGTGMQGKPATKVAE